jgi:uncharacterized membrane protein YdbT with pleckstrin-like domain
MASYVDSVLINGETVLHRGRISLWPHGWKILFGILLAPVIVGLGLLAWVFVTYRTTEIAITNKRIIAKSGFVSRSTTEINLPKIESLQVDQSVTGRLFNYGSIIIAGAGTPNMRIHGIADPLRFRRHFMEATDKPQ